MRNAGSHGPSPSSGDYNAHPLSDVVTFFFSAQNILFFQYIDNVIELLQVIIVPEIRESQISIFRINEGVLNPW